MKVNSDDLPRQLARGLASVYLVSGDEHLLVSEAADQVRKAAREQGFTDRDLHIAERGFDWSRIAIESANLSLFADKRLTEVRIPTGKPGRTGATALTDAVTNLGPDDCLLIIIPKLDSSNRNSAWVKKLAAAGVLVQVWPVSLQQLPAWISQRLKASGLTASRDAITMLADRAQGNLLAAQQEVTKLGMHFTSGKISAEDVAKSVADSARFDIFQLVDAALVGDASRSMRILTGLRAEGVEPTLVLWALAREIRTLATIGYHMDNGKSQDQAMTQARVWSNRKALAGRAARRLSGSGCVYELLVLAAHTDAIIKGQREGEPWMALRSLVMGLCQGNVSLSVA